MKRFLLSLTLAALATAPGLSANPAPATDKAEDTSRNPQHATLQIPFIKNIGQADDDIAFYADTFGGAVVVKKQGALELLVPLKKNGPAVIGESFVGARTKTIKGDHPAVTRVSYFYGSDPAKWHLGVPTYETVSFDNLYNGIDLELKAHGNNVEKLFHLRPGAKPDSIRIRVTGATSIDVTGDGFLEIETNDCVVHYSIPLAYQIIDNDRRLVDVAYRVTGDSYSFELGDYDKTRELIIDPLLQSTYFSGSGDDVVRELAIAPANGNVYAAGKTDSASIGGIVNTNADGVDAFVARFNPSLTILQQVSFIGGTGGGEDFATSVAIRALPDDQYEVYIAGETASPDLAGVLNPGSADFTFGAGLEGFVARFDVELGLLGSTYFGGSANDSVSAIAISNDISDSVFITGTTASTDLPGIVSPGSSQDSFAGGASDAFIARLSTDLTGITAATYLGGSGDDSAVDLVVDTLVYVTGNTSSDDLPGTTGNFQPARVSGTVDAFVSSADALLTNPVNSTYIGGNGDENVRSIANTGAEGSLVYLAGDTASTDFPGTTAGTDNNSFIAYINKDLAALTDFEAVYVGGNGSNDTLRDLAIHRESILFNQDTDTVYVTGGTNSAAFPDSADGEDEFLTGAEDAFLLRIDATLTDTADIQMTYLGGAETGDEFGHAIAADQANGIYVGGVTTANDFPLTVDGAIASSGGGQDGFLSRHGYTLQYAAEIKVSLTTIDFGDVFAGDESAEVQVSVNNLDSVNDLLIDSILLSDPSNYTLNDLGSDSACGSAGYPARVGPGENCTFKLKFNPTAGSATPYAATVTITSNDLSEPETVIGLTGTGGSDSDGVPDAEEQGPDGNDPSYDGNADGIADSAQASAASLHSQNDAFYVTIYTSDSNLSLEGVTTTPLPAPLPDNLRAPFGFYSYAVTGLTPGDTATVNFIMNATGIVDLAGDEDPDGFWKYGAQTAGAAEEWYDFEFDPATGTGATVDLNTVTLTFIDGQKGDHDFDPANGRIEDPGAPVKIQPADDDPLPSDSSGGGCFIATAAYGSYLQEDVRLLRDFRDAYLLSNSPGRQFVAAYYKYSPPVADYIRASETRRMLTRWLLTPLVYTIKHPFVALLLLVGAGGMLAGYRRRSGSKRAA